MSIDFSNLDQRHYPTLDVIQGYRLWSRFYEQGAEGHLVNGLLERLPPSTWNNLARVADLGCGTGRVGAWLRDRGTVELYGVDLSPEMLARAADRNIYARLLQADVRATGLAGHSCTLVMSSLTACHLQDIGPLYAEAARLLHPGGVFVLLDYHPFFLLNGIPTHFRTPGGETFAITNHVHLFSDHMRAALDAGFSLQAMDEMVVAGNWKNYTKYLNRPISFVLAWEAT